MRVFYYPDSLDSLDKASKCNGFGVSRRKSKAWTAWTGEGDDPD